MRLTRISRDDDRIERLIRHLHRRLDDFQFHIKEGFKTMADAITELREQANRNHELSVKTHEVATATLQRLKDLADALANAGNMTEVAAIAEQIKTDNEAQQADLDSLAPPAPPPTPA